MKKTILAVSLALIAGSAMATGGDSAFTTGSAAGGAAAANVVGAYSYSATNGSSISGAGQFTGTSVQTNVTNTRLEGHSYDVPHTSTDVDIKSNGWFKPLTVTETTVTTGAMSKTSGAQVDASATAGVVTEGYAYNKSTGYAGGGALAAGGGIAAAGVEGLAADFCNKELAGFKVVGAAAAGNLEVAGRNDDQRGGAAATVGIAGQAGVQTTKDIAFTNTEVNKYEVALCKPPKLVSHSETDVVSVGVTKSAWASDTKQVETSTWQKGDGFGLSGAAAGAIGGNFALVNSHPVNASPSELMNIPK